MMDRLISGNVATHGLIEVSGHQHSPTSDADCQSAVSASDKKNWDTRTVLEEESWQTIWNMSAHLSEEHWHLADLGVPVCATLREIESRVVCPMISATHPGATELDGLLLVVPWYSNGEQIGVELLDAAGHGVQLPEMGGVVSRYWPAQATEHDSNKVILIGVGVENARVASYSGNYDCFAVVNSKALELVASWITQCHPTCVITVLGDRDGSTGEVDPVAVDAARAVGARLACPDQAGTLNFCDLARSTFLEAIDLFIDVASCTNQGGLKTPLREDGWSDLPLLTSQQPRVPYPLHALPDGIRLAVVEVWKFVQAPLPLVASAAVSALSIAAQGMANVRRAGLLEGPIGVFMLTIAESGERKTKCDDIFMKPIRDFDRAQSAASKPLLSDYARKTDALESRIAGIKDRIKSLARAGKSSTDLDEVLLELERSRPAPPLVPRLIFDNTSSEALLYELATGWPSGGVISAEAGVVFGSHSLAGGDSVMRSLALFNQLWDGVDISVDRRTSDSFVLRGARFTMSLQVQLPTLTSFIGKSGNLARGMGFLARFLLACPDSTQGQRKFTDAPLSWSHLEKFHLRIDELLRVPLPIGADGVLAPPMIMMSEPARLAWIEYHDLVEGELNAGGQFFELRDVASKSAENAARLAALFQIFETGSVHEISLQNFQSASEIAFWHLLESKRFLCDSVYPNQVSDSVILEQWLIRRLQESQLGFINKNEVRQFGPSHLRRGPQLDAVLDELENNGRIRQVTEGRRTAIEIHPDLLVSV